MKVKYYICSIILLVCCYACYEDKGNYDYEDVNSFEITSVPTNQLSPYTIGDTVFASPVLKFALDSNEADLAFEWRLMGGRLIGTERNLAYVADTVNNNYLPVFSSVTVTNKKNGLRANALCIFMVYKKNFQEGWMILSETNNKAELNYLIWNMEYVGDEEIDSFDEYPRVFQQENGIELGGRPIKMQEFWAKGAVASHLLILQEGGLGSVCLSSSDYQKTITVNEEFMNGVYPAGFKPVSAIYGITNDMILNANGDLYLKKRSNPSAFYTGIFPDYPAYFERGLKISRLVPTNLWNVNFKLMFDDKNKRYLALNDDNEFVNMNHDPQPGFSNLYDMGNVDVVFCESFLEKSGGASFLSIYRNNDNGKYYIQKFRVQLSGTVQTITLVFDYEFPGQHLINANSVFKITRDTRQYLYFSGGVANDRLYCLDFSAGGDRVYTLYDYEGRQIVCMYPTNEERAKLGVALSDGKFCIMDASFEALTGSTICCETQNSYGKIADVIYKSNQAGSNQ